jgi:hypothetical protein
MIQKVKVNFGFTQLEIPSLNTGFLIIKLKFNQSSVDDIMTKFFESLGFTHHQTITKKGTNQVTFQFYVTTGNGLHRTTSGQNYLTYQETCNKVREFLIRKKITGLYDQLSMINPSVSRQVVNDELSF